MAKLLTAIILFASYITANASITASYCEKHIEVYAEKYFKESKFGTLKAKPRSVSIRRVMTATVIDGQRYKTTGQAHITYPGSTGGDVSEVRYFEGEIEDGDPKPSFVYFREIKDQK